MSYFEDRKIAHYSAKQVESSAFGNRGDFVPFKISREIINQTKHPITVADRTGVNVTIEPNKSPSRSNAVKILYTVEVGANVTFDGQGLFDVADISQFSEEMRVLHEAFKDRRWNHQTRSVTLVYTVDQQVLVDRGGTIYFHNLDLLISCDPDVSKIPVHPFSAVGTTDRLLLGEAINNRDQFGLVLFIIDNNGEFGERYINIAGRVYHVPAIRDPSRPDGIYLATSGPIKGNYAGTPPKAMVYDFDQVEDAVGIPRLFRSYNDAAVNGDEAEWRERQLKQGELTAKERELSIKLEKVERDLQRMRMEADGKERDHELKQDNAVLEEVLKWIKHQREKEAEERKEAYEVRQQRRKEIAEWVKMGLSLTASALALIALFKKGK